MKSPCRRAVARAALVMTLGSAAPAAAVVPYFAAPAPVVPPTPPAPAATPAPGTASAAPGAAPAATKLAEARLHFQQGVALYRDQNFDAALAEFQAAYAISAEPLVHYNLGLTHKALFRYGEAIDALERYLSESAARGQAVAKARRVEVEKIVAEMRSLLADVTLVVKPAAAAVLVDGRAVALGLEGIVKLPAGSHVVEASAPGYVADRRALTVVAGTPQTVSLDLVAVPRTGRLRVQASELGARVAVDGKDLGPSPVELELLAGGHTVEVAAPGYVPSRLEIAVAVGQARTVPVTLERPRVETHLPPIFGKWWFWAGLGAVAVGTTVAVVLWPASSQDPLTGSLGTSPSNAPGAGGP
jgi:hypothetical protein